MHSLVQANDTMRQDVAIHSCLVGFIRPPFFRQPCCIAWQGKFAKVRWHGIKYKMLITIVNRLDGKNTFLWRSWSIWKILKGKWRGSCKEDEGKTCSHTAYSCVEGEGKLSQEVSARSPSLGSLSTVSFAVAAVERSFFRQLHDDVETY